jgi:hypothetical protein
MPEKFLLVRGSFWNPHLQKWNPQPPPPPQPPLLIIPFFHVVPHSGLSENRYHHKTRKQITGNPPPKKSKLIGKCQTCVYTVVVHFLARPLHSQTIHNNFDFSGEGFPVICFHVL